MEATTALLGGFPVRDELISPRAQRFTHDRRLALAGQRRYFDSEPLSLGVLDVHRHGVILPQRCRYPRNFHVPKKCYLRPAASIPRSSFLRSAISSRKRAASSNCRSRAACIIWSVICWIRSASWARGIAETSLSTSIPELRTRSPCSGFLPRDELRPEPPTETCSLSSASLYTRSRMSAIFFRSGC